MSEDLNVGLQGFEYWSPTPKLFDMPSIIILYKKKCICEPGKVILFFSKLET